MTTKPKARKFRIRRDGPLTPGQAMAATEGATARKVAPPPVEQQPAPEAKAEDVTLREPSTAKDENVAMMEAASPDMHDDGFGPDMMPTAAAAARGKGAVQSGDVASAESARSEQTIADIRKEGLTGRQLRMARRVAQKHGLTPTSDFDAVKQLRDRGIDPFQRSAMLELVQNNAKAQGKGGGASPNLPQVARQAGPGTSVAVPQEAPVPGPALNSAEQRATEIGRIQQDIARRRRRKSLLLFTRLAFFVLLPAFIAGWYYYVLATPLYATKSEFLIQQAEPTAAAGLGGLFQGTSLATQQDSTTVQSYLSSRAAMKRLDAEHGFKAHFEQDFIDPIQRLEVGATDEAAYRLYQRNVKIGYDPSEGILKMEVIAATPEKSQEFSEALLSYAEEQVDQLTQRLREDQMKGARGSFEEAEAKVLAAQKRVLELQEKLGVLDPVSESGSLMSQITQFEVELRQKELDLQQQLSNARPNQARVRALEGEISRLKALVAELRNSMTQSTDNGASLARISGELRIAEADLATRQLLLQQAAAQLETARIEANRQVRYLSLGVAPIAPDEATYPRAFENTALALLIFAGIYLMISLTASVLREQVAA
ncbi:capsule biosynthesis protein [Vannielia litorea]|uniref:capsule biosynthesis protein n=1 Tax=Vannielia litorea TaxID=1217970 RepID=UPI001BCDAA2C|nr:capsule biosynthesis protein [Vannielia litorea]MBS8226236.1 capsule biosynthesis protein [Vannielia litorea]